MKLLQILLIISLLINGGLFTSWLMGPTQDPIRHALIRYNDVQLMHDNAQDSNMSDAERISLSAEVIDMFDDTQVMLQRGVQRYESDTDFYLKVWQLNSVIMLVLLFVVSYQIKHCAPSKRDNLTAKRSFEIMNESESYK